jgi:glyoxylase-like metal-dependent hydrolase (beta-lactamase superfamily II)
MTKIHIFIFNPFQVNTYVIADLSNECIIIDPGCYSKSEKTEFQNFITKNNLRPKYCINTHCHIDHVAGNNFIADTYGLKPIIHSEGLIFLKHLKEKGQFYGFEMEEPVYPEVFLTEGDLIQTQNISLKVIYTPGHADGSICLINNKDEYIISGDVLFYESIGRTDFETGDFEILSDNIHKKLFSLPDHYIVYPGHGTKTSIGHEKNHNPYL